MSKTFSEWLKEKPNPEHFSLPSEYEKALKYWESKRPKQ